MRLAIDFSNFSHIPLPLEIEDFIAKGYGRAIVGASYGSLARAQLVACSAGGMEIEAYAWVEFRDGWEGAIDRALAVIDGLPVRRLWLDCEEDPGDIGAVSRIAYAYGRVMLARPDLKDANAIGIYTRGSWWEPHTGNNTDFSRHPLWSAFYDNDPDIDFDAHPYGGWAAPAMEQYSENGSDVLGFNADLNVINEEEWMPTQQEFDELKRNVQSTFALALQAVKSIQALGAGFFALAQHTYGDNDPKLAAIQDEIAALEHAQKEAAK